MEKKISLLFFIFIVNGALYVSELYGAQSAHSDLDLLRLEIGLLSSDVEAQYADILAAQRMVNHLKKSVHEQDVAFKTLQSSLAVSSGEERLSGGQLQAMWDRLDSMQLSLYSIVDKQNRLEDTVLPRFETKIRKLEERLSAVERLEVRLCNLERKAQRRNNLRLQRAQEWFAGIEVAHALRRTEHDGQCSTRSASRATLPGCNHESESDRQDVSRSDSCNSSVDSNDDTAEVSSFNRMQVVEQSSSSAFVPRLLLSSLSSKKQ